MRKLLLLLISIFVVLPAFGQTKVQQASVAPTSVSGQTPITGTFAANTTAGNEYFVLARAGFNTGWGMAISDSEGNTWQSCAAANGGNATHQLQLWYAENVVGGTHDAISVNTTGNGASASTMSLVMFEYSGLATASSKDVCSATGGTGSTSPLSTTAITTTNANDLIIGGFGEGADTTWTAGSGFVVENSTVRVAFETKTVAATGSYQPQISVGTTATSWTAIAGSFKAAGGGGGPTVHQLTTMGVGMAQIAVDETNLLAYQFCTPSSPAPCTDTVQFCFSDGVCEEVTPTSKPVSVRFLHNGQPTVVANFSVKQLYLPLIITEIVGPPLQ
jgi:hypothetical protein